MLLAESKVKATFGLDPSLNLFELDPIALAASTDPAAAARGLQAQKLAAQLAEILSQVTVQSSTALADGASQAALNSLAGGVNGHIASA